MGFGNDDLESMVRPISYSVVLWREVGSLGGDFVPHGMDGVSQGVGNKKRDRRALTGAWGIPPG